jgi:CubicO group peptidase (beta-lactamase class C family)
MPIMVLDSRSRSAPPRGFASSTGSVGDFSWPGAFGTYWWGDPREELAVVWMTQTPGSARGKYQRMIRAMVNEAITD